MGVNVWLVWVGIVVFWGGVVFLCLVGFGGVV